MKNSYFTDEEISDIGILIYWKYPDGKISLDKFLSLPKEEQNLIHLYAIVRLEKLQKRIENRRKMEEAMRIKKEFKDKQSRPMTEEDKRLQREKKDKKWQEYCKGHSK
jgi:hypothetical protein